MVKYGLYYVGRVVAGETSGERLSILHGVEQCGRVRGVEGECVLLSVVGWQPRPGHHRDNLPTRLKHRQDHLTNPISQPRQLQPGKPAVL